MMKPDKLNTFKITYNGLFKIQARTVYPSYEHEFDITVKERDHVVLLLLSHSQFNGVPDSKISLRILLSDNAYIRPIMSMQCVLDPNVAVVKFTSCLNFILSGNTGYERITDTSELIFECSDTDSD